MHRLYFLGCILSRLTSTTQNPATLLDLHKIIMYLGSHGMIAQNAAFVKFTNWFKAPRFEPQHADMFFGALESEFLLHQVTNELEKYSLLLSFVDLHLLNEKAAIIVQNIHGYALGQRPYSDSYTTLKAAILDDIKSTDHKLRLGTLLKNEQFGDSKPSEFLARLNQIADPSGTGNQEFVAAAKKAWLAAIPAEWVNALEETADLNEAAMKADVFSNWQKDPTSAHLYQAAIATGKAPEPDDSNNHIDPKVGARLAQLEGMVSQLEEVVSQLSSRLSRQQIDNRRNRTPSPSKSKKELCSQPEKANVKAETEQTRLFDIIKDSSDPSQFCCKLKLAHSVFGLIIGPKGSVHRRIQEETKTKIIVPSRSDDKWGEIVVRGNSAVNVEAACREIHLVLETNKCLLYQTHFLCIPVDPECIKETHDKFKKMWKLCNLDLNLLQANNKLHLSLGQLVLLNDHEVAAATKIVEEFVHQELRERYPKLKLLMGGLESWQGDLSQTRSLHVDAVRNSNHAEVLKLMKKLSTRLINAGFLKKGKYSSEGIELYMNIADSKFAIKKQNGEELEFSGSNQFDATNILMKFENIYFGELIIESLRICELDTDTEKDGYKIVSEHFLDLKKANPSYLTYNADGKGGKLQQPWRRLGLNNLD